MGQILAVFAELMFFNFLFFLLYRNRVVTEKQEKGRNTIYFKFMSII